MSMIASIEARIKEYETAISNSLANHNGLLGGLNELKSLLEVAGKVVEVVDPSAVPVVSIVEEVAEAL